MGYRLTFDYHTHTVFSHGSGTIEDNINEARKKGLSEIAISDHGPALLEYGITLDDIPKMRSIIDDINDSSCGLKVYLSIEANIIDSDNGLDITKEDCNNFDFITAGYHYGVADGYCGTNFWNYTKGIRNRDLIMKNTEMALKAIYENNLTVLTHPGDKAFFDIDELAHACAETNTLVEINNHHKTFNVPQISKFAEKDVRFIIGSDAHSPEDVGSYKLALSRAIAAGLDLQRIVNLEITNTEED